VSAGCLADAARRAMAQYRHQVTTTEECVRIAGGLWLSPDLLQVGFTYRHRFCAQGATSAAHAAARAAGERNTAARGNPGQAAFSTPRTPLLGCHNDGSGRSSRAAFIRSSCKLTGFRTRPSLCTPRVRDRRPRTRSVAVHATAPTPRVRIARPSRL